MNWQTNWKVFLLKKREKINYALKTAQLYQILAKTIKNPPFYKGLFVCKSFTAERKSCRRLLYCCPAKVCTFSLQTKLSHLFLRKNEKFFILIKNGAFFKHHDLAHYFCQSFAKALDFSHRLEMTGAERIKVSFY